MTSLRLVNRIYISLLVAMMVLFVPSCSKQDSAKVDTAAKTDTAAINTDTVPSTAPVEEENAYKKFKTSADALEFMRSSGSWDKYADGILVRMAVENLPYCEKLLNNEHPRFIVVDKGSMRVILYDKYGRKEKEYGCACARNYGTKHKKADSRTPEGFFEAEGIYDSTEWLFVDDNGVKSKVKGQFGPRFIRLKCPNTSQIGIHGTCAPGSIGRRCSHGCIRITNDNILELVKYAEKGMPIIVNPGPKDISVNKEEGYNVPWITIDDKPMLIKDTPVQQKKEESTEAETTNASEEQKNVNEVVQSEETKPEPEPSTPAVAPESNSSESGTTVE